MWVALAHFSSFVLKASAITQIKMGSYNGITRNGIAQKGNPSWNYWKLLSLGTAKGHSLSMVKGVAPCG